MKLRRVVDLIGPVVWASAKAIAIPIRLTMAGSELKSGGVRLSLPAMGRACSA